MDRRTGIGLSGVAFGLVALVTTYGGGVAGATSGTVSIDAATMAYHATATHFKAPTCAVVGTADPGREFQGTVDGVGSYFGAVALPQGARITRLRLSVRDNDADQDGHAVLVRKRLAGTAGLNGFEGYTVLAQVASAGASTDLRRFTTTSVLNPKVDDRTFAYFVELVNCANTVDPIGVQVDWLKP